MNRSYVLFNMFYCYAIHLFRLINQLFRLLFVEGYNIPDDSNNTSYCTIVVYGNYTNFPGIII